MQPFVYNALPARVIFGWGTIKQVAAEVKALGCVSNSLGEPRKMAVLTRPIVQSTRLDYTAAS